VSDRGRRVRAAAPAALDSISEVADLLGGRSDRSRRLMGGVAAGALLGAALAGVIVRSVAGRGLRPKP
jgi:hypothetical protein